MKINLDPVESFDVGMLYLTRFAARVAHTDVPPRHKEGYFALGRWVADVRARHADLTPEQVVMLEGLPMWGWHELKARTRNDSTYDFEEGYALLRDYVAANGDARVRQMVSGETTPLGIWVKRTRSRYGASALNNSEIARLDALPGWVWSEQDARYQDHVDEVVAFASAEGHIRISPTYRDSSGFRLGQWFGRQIAAFARGELSRERQRLLMSIPGWPLRREQSL